MATSAPSTAIGSTEASGLQPPNNGADKAFIQRSIPLLTRIRLFLRIWFMKSSITLLLQLMRLAAIIKRNQSILPTYTKTYPVRPGLSNRIFIPKSHKAGITHPLLLMIHGGGFALCDPAIDDSFNRAVADQYNFVVVSINYRKSPTHRFPIAVHDSAEIARAILSDTDLPVDLSKKASLGGFSAGGNLALAIAQLPGIKDRISAIVPVYPVVDFVGKNKGAFRSTPDGKEDRLKNMSPLFNWAYIPAGQDLSDPLLSPIYVKGREDLPQRIFFVGAEFDYLCHEAEVMARNLAQGKAVEGSFVDVKNEDKVEELSGDEWEKNGVKWREVKGVVHGWTHRPERGEKEALKQNELKRLYKEVAEWCLRE